MATTNVAYPVPVDLSTLLSALKSLRESGASLGQIARRFGVSDMAVLYWLRGTRKPSRAIRVAAHYVLAQAGNVSPGLPSIGGQSAPDLRGIGVVTPRPAKARKARGG